MVTVATRPHVTFHVAARGLLPTAALVLPLSLSLSLCFTLSHSDVRAALSSADTSHSSLPRSLSASFPSWPISSLLASARGGIYSLLSLPMPLYYATRSMALRCPVCFRPVPLSFALYSSCQCCPTATTTPTRSYYLFCAAYCARARQFNASLALSDFLSLPRQRSPRGSPPRSTRSL